MTEKVQSQKVPSMLKWLTVTGLIALGVIGNYWYQEHSLLVRVLVLLFLFGSAGWVAAQTTLGQEAIQFIKGARGELNKVVWPTRQETVQSTWIVVAMVTVMGLVLWGFDAVLLRVVAWLTGYGAA